MDEQANKTALRRIPYGLFLLTARHGEDVASATVNWVTQTSFGPVPPAGNKLGPLTFRPGATGAPVINELPAYWECQLREIVEQGDHHVFLGEVVEAGVNSDTPTLLMRETPWNYGG